MRDLYKAVKIRSFSAKAIFAAMMFFVFSTAAFAATDLSVYMVGSLGGSNTTVRDSDTTTPLPIGSLIQYIYAGADGIANPPSPGGGTTGDDVLVSGTYAVGDGGTGLPGTFAHYIVGLTSSAKVYVRAWNASTVLAATNYGESVVITLNSGPPLLYQTKRPPRYFFYSAMRFFLEYEG